MFSKRFGHLQVSGTLVGFLLVAGCSNSYPVTPVRDMAVATGASATMAPMDQTPMGQTMQDEQGQVNAMDRLFVVKVSQANLEEVALGELAVQKATTDSVKNYARMMVEDHGKSQQELETAANDAGLQPPTELPPEAKAIMERLSKLSGLEFDREYMKVMVMGHEKAVTLFSQEASKGENPGLVSYAKKTLPVIEHHLMMARQILAQLQ